MDTADDTQRRRIAKLSQLQQDTFDVVIVGGGISGAWIALHCSTLGLKTAIIERRDFGSETSSASSKILHGGVRYLQQLDFGKVRESSLERAEYLRAAPHLASPINFLIPTFNEFKKSKFLVTVALKIYRLLGLGQLKRFRQEETPDLRERTLSREYVNQQLGLNHLPHTGAAVFPEFHMYDSERTVWALIDSAASYGAVPFNYLTVNDLTVQDGRVSGVKATDEETGQSIEIKTKLVVNAAGPWIDSIIRCAHSKNQEPPHQIVKSFATGAHIITRSIGEDYAVAVSTDMKSATSIDRGGRHIFVIPWRGYSLIGTSYRETDDPDNAQNLLAEDLEQLLHGVEELFPAAKLTANDIKASYFGLYPLKTDNKLASTYQGSGEYIIRDHAKTDDINGLITSLGAKFTTARLLSEKTMPLILSKLDRNSSSEKELKRCLRVNLPCAAYENLDAFIESQIVKHRHKFSEEQIQHFVKCYGSNIDRFLSFLEENNENGDWLIPICNHQPDIIGQVAWAVKFEQCVRLDDVLLRRLSIGLLGISRSEIDTIAKVMADILDWSEAKIHNEIATVDKRMKHVESITHSFYNNGR